MNRIGPWGLVLLALGALGFGPCRIFQPAETLTPSPVRFQQLPTLQELIEFRNLSTASIRTLQTTGATLTVRGMPSLRAELYFEAPRNLRLRAGTGFTGGELDLGSNPDLFWVWVKRNSPPGTYYARHDQYATSAARQHMPVEPSWLMEAIGLVTFDPSQQHQGPVQTAADRLEIRTAFATPQGEMLRVTTIHAQYGYVLEQKILDRTGRLVAEAICSRHQYDLASGASLPLTVAISVPAAEMAFTLDVASHVVNQPIASAPSIWLMPQYDGYPAIDLADPRLPGPNQLPAPGSVYPAPAAAMPGPAATPPLTPLGPAPAGGSAPATAVPWPGTTAPPSTAPLLPGTTAYPAGPFPSARGEGLRYRGQREALR